MVPNDRSKQDVAALQASPAIDAAPLGAPRHGVYSDRLGGLSGTGVSVSDGSTITPCDRPRTSGTSLLDSIRLVAASPKVRFFATTSDPSCRARVIPVPARERTRSLNGPRYVL